MFNLKKYINPTFNLKIYRKSIHPTLNPDLQQPRKTINIYTHQVEQPQQPPQQVQLHLHQLHQPQRRLHNGRNTNAIRLESALQLQCQASNPTKKKVMKASKRNSPTYQFRPSHIIPKAQRGLHIDGNDHWPAAAVIGTK